MFCCSCSKPSVESIPNSDTVQVSDDIDPENLRGVYNNDTVVIGENTVILNQTEEYVALFLLRDSRLLDSVYFDRVQGCRIDTLKGYIVLDMGNAGGHLLTVRHVFSVSANKLKSVLFYVESTEIESPLIDSSEINRLKANLEFHNGDAFLISSSHAREVLRERDTVRLYYEASRNQFYSTVLAPEQVKRRTLMGGTQVLGTDSLFVETSKYRYVRNNGKWLWRTSDDGQDYYWMWE